MTAKLIVIDNYDSFTYNLVQMFRQYALEVMVHRCDAITTDQVTALAPDYILISPGPKTPKHSGISMELIKAWYRKIPILGVCLGMQCINEAFGGSTIRSAQPLHGRTSAIYHDGNGIFQKMPYPFQAARYHSLAIAPAPKTLQGELIITAQTKDQMIMGISHRNYPLHGVQFHPESFMTQYGIEIINNFLKLGPVTVVEGDRQIG